MIGKWFDEFWNEFFGVDEVFLVLVIFEVLFSVSLVLSNVGWCLLFWDFEEIYKIFLVEGVVLEELKVNKF